MRALAAPSQGATPEHGTDRISVALLLETEEVPKYHEVFYPLNRTN